MWRKQMTKKRMLRIVCWSLIILFPLSELVIGYDSSDIGFILNQYEFVFTDCNTVYLPLLFTDICGNLFLRVFRFFSMPEYLAFEVLWALCVYYLCFMSERLYRKYYDNELILPALAAAVIFAKTNLNFFMYNTTVAVFSLTSLYFFVVGVNEKKNTSLRISVIFLCFSVLSKISAAIQIVMYVVLFYDFYIRKDKKLFARQLFSCLAGGIIGLALCAAVIASSCGVDKYLTMLGDMFLYAGNSADGHAMGNMILINIKGVMHGFVWLVLAVGTVLLFRIKPFERFSVAVGRVLAVLACVYVVGGVLNACGMEVVPSII